MIVRFAVLVVLFVDCCVAQSPGLRTIAIQSAITDVQPMTGIVLWSTNANVERAPIQLEYAYLTYRQVVTDDSHYDWTAVDELLASAATRKHQVILRWHDTYVGKPTGIPALICDSPGYQTTIAKSEGKPTEFPDWSSKKLQSFVLQFFTDFAKRYDRDRRIAFVQVGFGLWAEYHIYDGPMVLGVTFPSKAYQTTFATHLDEVFDRTPWMISVDAAGDHAPFESDASLRQMRFGVFDDSLNHKTHTKENEPNWDLFGRDRWRTSPAGGELSYFSSRDQRMALAATGPHGESFENHASRFHLSFAIGDDQMRFQTPQRFRAAAMSLGYRFRITRLTSDGVVTHGSITNEGIAPIYHDAFVTLNGTRSDKSLRHLCPGESIDFVFNVGVENAPDLTIQCDRLVPGQLIQYAADLPGDVVGE